MTRLEWRLYRWSLKMRCVLFHRMHHFIKWGRGEWVDGKFGEHTQLIIPSYQCRKCRRYWSMSKRAKKKFHDEFGHVQVGMK